MKQFIDNLISRLEERKKEWTAKGIEFSFAGGTTIVDERAFGTGSGLYEAIGIVNQLAEEYKGGWIPCSVELPKYMERAITCDEKGNIHVFPCDGKYFLDECCKRITENHERYYVPIAWMPLPSPYHPEK